MPGGIVHSTVTFEKPMPHLSLPDWHGRLTQLQYTAETRRRDGFDLRHQARQLRNETRIKTEWDTYHNNVRLGDRITEVSRWHETLTMCLNKVIEEIASLREEKANTEDELDYLTTTPIKVVSECISIRDGRLGAEITYDDGDTELKKELCVIENNKKLLMDRCQAAWEKINRMLEVKFKLELDINDKHETIGIDKDMLTLDKDCANISFKPDPLRIAKKAIPYETWLEHSRYTKLLADNELADTAALREALFVSRERARNELKAQQDCTDFTLRKRIYETQRARNELAYQAKLIKAEMEKIADEIITLERALLDKTDALKLAETRLEGRMYRPGFELARDEPDFGLQDEVKQLRQTRFDLMDKIDCAKATLNALEEHSIRIDRDLANKEHSLMTDIRCLDLRAQLKGGRFGNPLNKEKSQTDRNIELTRMEKEIPPT